MELAKLLALLPIKLPSELPIDPKIPPPPDPPAGLPRCFTPADRSARRLHEGGGVGVSTFLPPLAPNERPIIARNDEFVIGPNATRSIGTPVLRQINDTGRLRQRRKAKRRRSISPS